ncbi:hypothetical protein QYF36_023293 [Acer negundo]|nr:hypothetical protein QYF36_023293 [Acer negundo]
MNREDRKKTVLGGSIEAGTLSRKRRKPSRSAESAGALPTNVPVHWKLKPRHFAQLAGSALDWLLPDKGRRRKRKGSEAPFTVYRVSKPSCFIGVTIREVSYGLRTTIDVSLHDEEKDEVNGDLVFVALAGHYAKKRKKKRGSSASLVLC